MLQFITHTNSRFPDEAAGALQALEGGCRWIQLRMKGASTSAIIEKGRQIADLCCAYDATFILDDHVELVDAIGAHGVHLGKNDMPIHQARELLGPYKIIGATANTFEDIRKAIASGADYIGLGPFRFTTTKEKLSPMLGLSGYEEIMRRCREEGIVIDVVAIGGITVDDLPALLQTGISGVAVSGAILNADEPVDETQKLLLRILTKGFGIID